MGHHNDEEEEDRNERHHQIETSNSIIKPFSSLLNLSQINLYQPLLALFLFISTVFRIAEGCSSRSTPKPRPASPTSRPNITFQTYACPEAYAKWYCLNGATCFSVRIGESILYNCECADGFMGQRCEFKDLDGSYLPSREKVMIETANIAGGVLIAVLFMVFLYILCFTYISFVRKNKILRLSLWRKNSGGWISRSKSYNSSSTFQSCVKYILSNAVQRLHPNPGYERLDLMEALDDPISETKTNVISLFSQFEEPPNGRLNDIIIDGSMDYTTNRANNPSFKINYDS